MRASGHSPRSRRLREARGRVLLALVATAVVFELSCFGFGVTSTANPINVGQSVTFTASIAPANGVIPTGTVTFRDNGVDISGLIPVMPGSSNYGVATFMTAFPSAGTHPIVASYSGDGNYSAMDSPPLSQVVLGGPANYFAVTPCRLLDTRSVGGSYGGPALSPTSDRSWVAAGQCGVPANANAIATNIVITSPTAAGNLRLYPAGTPAGNTSVINYGTGQTRANNAVLALGGGGFTIHVDQPSGTVQVIIDVNGYYQ